MESKANYALVGIAVVILTLGLLAVGLWLSVGFDRKAYHFYTVYMSESVSGLTEESTVRYNGVKVGTISKISIDKENPQQVKLILKIEDGTPIFENTRATLIMQGITGTTFLGLSANSPCKIPLKKLPTEPYPIIPYEPSFLNQVQKTMIDLSKNLKAFLSDENARNLKLTLNNLQKISKIFADNEQSIDGVLKKMPKLTDALQTSVTDFDKMSLSLSAAGLQLNTTMRTGQTALEQFSQQALPTSISLLQRFNVIAGDLGDVTNAMSRNPSAIIWGAPPLKKGPGE